MQKYNAKRVERSIAAAKTVAAAAVAHTCLIPVKVKVGDDIYGSVSIQDIVDNFATAGIEIPKTSVLLSSPIKRLGAYDVVVKLHKTVSVTIKVVVVNELAPAVAPVAVEQIVEQTEEA